MSKPSWIEALVRNLHRIHRPDRRPRVAILGLGYELRGDDAAGVNVARMLKIRLGDSNNWPDDPRQPAFLIIEAGSAPENVTGPLRSFHPNLVILVDAADLRTIPGTVRWIDWRETVGLSASTHTLPIHIFARYLVHELDSEVAVLGIQPATDALGLPLSILVQHAAESIAGELESVLSHPIEVARAVTGAAPPA